MKTTVTITVILFISVSVALAADKTGPRPENLPVFTGDEILPDVPVIPPSPMEPIYVIGTTQYDYQTNGSTGNRCVVDSDGGVHFTWMNGISYPSQRAVYYNYVDTLDNWLEPTPVSQANGAGYTQIAVTTDDLGAIAYHSANSPSIENYVVAAIDNFTGFGIFRYVDPPDLLTLRCYWPYVSIDINNVIHIVCNENAPNAGDPQALGYTNSVDTGSTWSNLIPVDTLMTISPNVVSSPVSSKTAIVYTHPLNYDTQWENDIYYIESQDGLTWDWNHGKVNVTGYGPPDSLYAYTDLAAIYDYNDNLHIIWNAQWLGETVVYYKTFLLHYDRDSGVISEITSSIDEWIDGCDPGVWNRPICKMSLGVSQMENSLVAAYTGFDTSDCSAGGYANGDIYMQYSCDNGATWTDPENLTDTQTPGCTPGNCDSENWSSLADKVNEYIHMIYIDDLDAGGIPQTEGTITTNPVMYYKAEAPECPLGIDSGLEMPVTFSLYQNYPNPFNARTEISFELGSRMEIDLSVYDIAGRKVASLVQGEYATGQHTVIWNADEYSSGVYFYRLIAGAESYTRKMTLLR